MKYFLTENFREQHNKNSCAHHPILLDLSVLLYSIFMGFFFNVGYFSFKNLYIEILCEVWIFYRLQLSSLYDDV